MKNPMKAALLILTVVSPVTFADIAIVVHPDNPMKYDATHIRNIYLGKVKVFDNGLPVFPIDIEPGDEVRDVFLDKILRKSEANLNAYWARMLFSSKGHPPEEVENSAAVIATVSSNKSAIGYVDAAKVNESVKVLAILK